MITAHRREAVYRLTRLVESLSHALKTSGTRPESEKARTLRLLKISGIGIGVGVATALTAGLAVPVVAAGLGAGAATLGLSGAAGLSAFLSTAAGSAAVAGLIGAGSASLTGWKYGRRVGRLKVFRFEPVRPIGLMHSTLARMHPTEERLLVEWLFERREVLELQPAKKKSSWRIGRSLFKKKKDDVAVEDDSILDEDTEESIFPINYVHMATIICVEGWIIRRKHRSSPHCEVSDV